VRPSRRDRGAAAVEAALILPVLLLIVFGIIDFGRMLNTQIALTEGAREGARAVALGVDPQPRVDTATGGRGDVTDLTECGSDPAPGDDAEVTVTHTFSFVTPVGGIAGVFGGGGWGDDLELTGVGVMPCRA
jgi:hypothetical protein